MQRRERPRRQWRLVVAVTALAMVSAACGGGGGGGSAVACELPGDGEPRSGGDLVYGVGAETSGWSPSRDRWATAGNQVAKAFLEPLAVYDADHEPVPWLAESIVPNGDHTVWTITARSGIGFHDGDTFDAEAMAANFQALIDSPLTSLALAPVDELDVVDDMTLEIRLSEPWVAFPHVLTSQGGHMAAPSMLAAEDGRDHPVGTGPFEFVEWQRDAFLRVERFDDYWLEGYPLLDSIEFRPLTDNDSRLATFRADGLDITPTAAPNQITQLEAEAERCEVRLWLDRESETLENFTILGTGQEPFDDLRARRALAHATDKEGLIETLHGGVFEPANGLFHQSSPWSTGVEFPQYDPDEARRLVGEYESEHGTLEFDFLGTSNIDDIRIRQALQQQWVEVGIEAKLVDLDATSHIVRVLSGDFQASQFALFTAQHPDGDYHFLHSSTMAPEGELGLNILGIRSDELDAALDRARGSDDPVVQKDAYATVDEVLADQVPMVFLWHSLTALAAQPSVRDVTTWQLPDGSEGLGLFGVIHPLHQIWLAE